MKYVIITQLRNQELRVYDWIKYHSSQGFDTFIIFDDYSDDGTILEIERAKTKLSVNIILKNSDGVGGRYDSTSSQKYAEDVSLHQRLCRSYDSGLKIAKEINEDSICAVIDVDEFLLSDSDEKVTHVIEEIFNDNGCQQVLVFNFDIRHDYIL